MPNYALSLPGLQTDPAAWQLQGAQSARAKIDNQLEALKLNEVTEKTNALSAYRNAVRAGDENALKTLDPYPEIQSQLYTALQSMKPDEVEAAAARTRALGRAANTMKALVGKPEYADTLDQVLGGLVEQGYATPLEAETWKRAENPDFLIEQALTAEQMIDRYLDEQKKGKLTADQSLKVEDAVDKFRKAYFGDVGQFASMALDED